MPLEYTYSFLNLLQILPKGHDGESSPARCAPENACHRLRARPAPPPDEVPSRAALLNPLPCHLPGPLCGVPAPAVYRPPAVYRAPCAVYRAPCAVRPAPCAVRPALCAVCRPSVRCVRPPVVYRPPCGVPGPLCGASGPCGVPGPLCGVPAPAVYRPLCGVFGGVRKLGGAVCRVKAQRDLHEGYPCAKQGWYRELCFAPFWRGRGFFVCPCAHAQGAWCTCRRKRRCLKDINVRCDVYNSPPVPRCLFYWRYH